MLVGDSSDNNWPKEIDVKGIGREKEVMEERRRRRQAKTGRQDRNRGRGEGSRCSKRKTRRISMRERDQQR